MDRTLSLAVALVVVGCEPAMPGHPEADDTSTTSPQDASTGGTDSAIPATTTSSSSSGKPSSESSSGGAVTSSTGNGANCEDEPSCEGCVSWDDEFDGRSGDNDRFANLSLALNGDVLAVGNQDRSFLIGGSGDARIARYSAEGTLLWARVISAEVGSYQAESAVFEDDGTILVALEANPSQNDPTQTWIVRLEANGELIGEPDFVADVAPKTLMRIGDDHVLHSYERFRPEGGSETRLDRLEGNMLTPLLPLGSFQELVGRDVEVSAAPGDGILVAGGTLDQVPYLARVESAGDKWTIAWSLQDFDFESEGETRIAAAAGAEDGSVLYAATTADALITGLLGPDQTPVWTREQDLACCFDAFPKVVIDPLGRMFLIGNQPGTSTPLRVVALSGCDGTALWTLDFGNGDLSPSSLVTSGQRLFAAGTRALEGVDTSAWVLGLDL